MSDNEIPTSFINERGDLLPLGDDPWSEGYRIGHAFGRLAATIDGLGSAVQDLRGTIDKKLSTKDSLGTTLGDLVAESGWPRPVAGTNTQEQQR